MTLFQHPFPTMTRPTMTHPLVLFLISTVLLTGCFGEKVNRPPPPETQIEPTEPVVTQIKMDDKERFAALDKLRGEKSQKFVLGKGDVLSISVYNEPDLDVKALPVRPDGMISYPLIGDVVAEYKTVQELRDDITKRLSKFVKAPKVSVIVAQFNSLEYTIIGEVVRPGVFPLSTNVSLSKAIAKSGGLTKGQFHASSVELADLTHAFISRDNKVLPVNFVALLRNGDLRHDIPLHPGDYIYIPSGLSKEIYVLGEVNRADLFAFREDMPLSKALVIAKGFTPDADLKRIHIVRGSLDEPTLYVVDLEAVLNGEATDVALRPGDIVYVPPTGLTEWSRMLDKIMPTVQALQTMILLRETVSGSSN